MVNRRGLARRIVSTAWPAVLEMMLYMTIGFVDVAMVGRLGPGPLAAVSLGAEIFFSLLMILAALGMGATVLAAQAAGAGQSQRVNHIAGQTLLLAVSLGLLRDSLLCEYTFDYGFVSGRAGCISNGTKLSADYDAHHAFCSMPVYGKRSFPWYRENSGTPGDGSYQ